MCLQRANVPVHSTEIAPIGNFGSMWFWFEISSEICPNILWKLITIFTMLGFVLH